MPSVAESTPLRPPSRTLVDAIEATAAADARRTFQFLSEPIGPDVTSGERVFSYPELERATAQHAGVLQALGLRKGERVALVLPDNAEFVLWFLGAIRAGIVPVPIYPPAALGQLASSLATTRHIVDRGGARVLLTTRSIKRLLGTVQARCHGLGRVIAVESLAGWSARFRPVAISPDDVAFLQFTSGSTAQPKGVTLTHANLAANIHCIVTHGLRARPGEDVCVSWLPLYHDMGLIGFVLSPLWAQARAVFLPPMAFVRRPSSWLRALSQVDGTISYAPNFAYALTVKRVKDPELDRVDLSRWRVAGCGAEPIRPETLEVFSTRFAPVGFQPSAFLPSYGMAESSLAVAFAELGGGMKAMGFDAAALWESGEARRVDAAAPGAVRLVSCGRAFPGHQIAIFDPDDAASTSPLAEGRVGEIRLRGESVTRGYWDDPDHTREAFAGDYLRTGDLGFLHREELYVCGRSKELVIVNGRNYCPQDMEWEVSKVAGIRKGNVVAFGGRGPGGSEGDREHIAVVFEVQDPAGLARAAALEAAARRAVQEGVGILPDDVVALAPGTLPKTSSGKLQRIATRALYEAGKLQVGAPARRVSTVGLARHTVMSQLSYLKVAVLDSLGKPR